MNLNPYKAPRRGQLSLPNRFLAGLLAAAWIGASLLVIFLALAGRHWLILVPALFGFWYGHLWVRVAVEGHLLSRPDGFLPRRRRRPPVKPGAGDAPGSS